MIRDFLIALSLANLCFIRVWPDVLNDVSAERYYLKVPLSTIDVLVLILAVFLLAGTMWVAVTWARRSGKSWALNLARCTFLLTLSIPLNGLRAGIPALSLGTFLATFGRAGTLLLIMAIFVLAAFAVVTWRRNVIQAAARVVLVTSPFVLYTFAQAAWPLVKHAGVHIANKPSVATFSQRPPLRIVWLVFDEMDQHAAFEGRPSTLKLPELDRFRRQAIYATHARSPANQTEEAMPALITGRLIADAEPSHPNELMITFRHATDPVPWSRIPNVFSEARKAGINSAVTGWYHPYCRVLGDTLTNCSWQPYETKYGTHLGRTWVERMVWLTTLVNTIPFAERLSLKDHLESATGMEFPDRDHLEIAILRYLSILRDAQDLVADPALGLVLVHWPIPHPPGLYDASEDEFAWDVKGDYVDNLALVDRSLGALRRQMEKANLWDSSLVLITSDHPYRIRRPSRPTSSSPGKTIRGLDMDEVGRYIPFLVKLPGQKESITYDQPFNSVLIPDLFMAFLDRKLSQPEKLVEWLNHHKQSKVEEFSGIS